MAENVIELLLNELSRVVKEEVNLQRGVREQIQKVKKELDSMKAFLRYADAKKEEDPRFKSWVEQVRDVSFQIEDVVDEYLYRLADADLRDNTRLNKVCSCFKKLKMNHQIGSRLQSIKGEVRDTTERARSYGAVVPLSLKLYDEQGSSNSRSSKATTQEIDRYRRSTVDESQLVGIQTAKIELQERLNDGDPKLKVLAIVGMGGLGKTAMARQILRDASGFKRRAFAIVSKTLKEDEFLRDIILQLFPEEAWGIQNLPIDHVKRKLRERLEDDSYLIVVDDLWTTKDWDQIKVSFPRNNHGSRVMVTTRNDDVANLSTKEYDGHVHKLQPLSNNDSWDLFCKKTFSSKPCPSNLVPICQDIIFNKCKGVPLAILAISGLLATLDEHNIDRWRKSKEDRFVDVIRKGNHEMEIRAKRLSIHHYDEIKSNILPQLRSFLYFKVKKSDNASPETTGIPNLHSDNFKMLNVLDLTDAPLDTFPEEISTLYLLRHLRLRKTKISKVPMSIGNLRRLETLDLKYTCVTELPNEISMLQKLRYLLISNCNQELQLRSVDEYYFPGEHKLYRFFYESYGVKVTSNIGCLVLLQHLCLIEVPEDKDWLKGLGRLTQLRKLGLFNLKEQHWEQVYDSISKMTNLLSLKLQTYGSFKLDYMRNPPPLLQRLHLEGKMDELPSWVCCSSLPDLQVLKLFNTKLNKDPGASLGNFPNLTGLILNKAFNKDVKMRVVLPDYFPSLRVLQLHDSVYLMIDTQKFEFDREGEWKRIAYRTASERYHAIGLDKVISLSS
ncbi:hypothetical protein RJT34_11089 [Clitoria ternatea]|uniref:Uncharacterized protein n=1 Tax=Clitoria ternatea TaxID=43366 RepID=A0AAN9JJU4_CLITE